MLFMHENNLRNKIQHNYKGLGEEIEAFYQTHYLPTKQQLLAISFGKTEPDSFRNATEIFNSYYDALKHFSSDHPEVKSQSKFESTFLEEISTYLFHALPEITDGSLGVYNKRIFAGLKINNDKTVDVITKDVDFCIGKAVSLSIDQQAPTHLVLPVVAVEVKTFLDATMFGEVKSSSKAIKSASPNAKTYVLMGYRSLADAHIIAARNDSALTEMFALRANANDPMRADVIQDYWQEICTAVTNMSADIQVNTIGRLLKTI